MQVVAKLQGIRFSPDTFNKCFGIILLADVRPNLGSVFLFTHFIQFRNADEFPLHRFPVFIQKNFFFIQPDLPRFLQGIFTTAGNDEAKLFIKLCVGIITGYDLVNNFCEEVFHGGEGNLMD